MKTCPLCKSRIPICHMFSKPHAVGCPCSSHDNRRYAGWTLYLIDTSHIVKVPITDGIYSGDDREGILTTRNGQKYHMMNTNYHD